MATKGTPQYAIWLEKFNAKRALNPVSTVARLAANQLLVDLLSLFSSKNSLCQGIGTGRKKNEAFVRFGEEKENAAHLTLMHGQSEDYILVLSDSREAKAKAINIAKRHGYSTHGTFKDHLVKSTKEDTKVEA